jgi:hypothetical protein
MPAEDAPTPTPDLVEGIPPRETVVTFKTHFASYNAGESAAFTPDEAQKLVDEGVGVLGGGPNDPPINIDIPHAIQQDNVVDCTMGNWTGAPTGYAYQWKNDGADIGDGTVPYTITAGDVGHTITCVVTATNAAGSTAAPPSNDVVVTEPTTIEASHARRRTRS